MEKVFAGASLDIAGVDSLSFPARQMVRQIMARNGYVWYLDGRSSFIEVTEDGDVTEVVRFAGIDGEHAYKFTFLNGILTSAQRKMRDSLENQPYPAMAANMLMNGFDVPLYQDDWDDEMIAVSEYDEIAAEATFLGQENAKGDAPWTREMSERYAEILDYDTY